MPGFSVTNAMSHESRGPRIAVSRLSHIGLGLSLCASTRKQCPGSCSGCSGCSGCSNSVWLNLRNKTCCPLQTPIVNSRRSDAAT